MRVLEVRFHGHENELETLESLAGVVLAKMPDDVERVAARGARLSHEP